MSRLEFPKKGTKESWVLKTDAGVVMDPSPTVVEFALSSAHTAAVSHAKAFNQALAVAIAKLAPPVPAPASVPPQIDALRVTQGPNPGELVVTWGGHATRLDKTGVDVAGNPWGTDNPISPLTLTGLVVGTTVTVTVKAADGTVLNAAALVAGAVTPPVPAPPVVTPGAVPLDSIGVCTNLNWDGNPNGPAPAVETAIGWLGVKHIRNGWGTGSGNADDMLVDLRLNHGVQMTFVVDPWDGSDVVARVDHIVGLLKRAPGCVHTIEGGNEWDQSRFNVNGWDVRDDNWHLQLRKWTDMVTLEVRKRSELNGVKLAAPSMANTGDTARYTKVGFLARLDYGTTHDYPGNAYRMTEAIANIAVANARIIAGPGKPVIATETGPNWTLRTDGDFLGTPEAAGPAYITELYRLHWAAGIVRTFIYKLVDDGTDGSFGQSWGLYHAAGNAIGAPRPAAQAVRDLVIAAGG